MHIIENIGKHVGCSLLNYLYNNNLLFVSQSAFRKNYSIETDLIKLTDKILFYMDNDKLTGLLFSDFRKSFDIISHHIILEKLGI